MCSLSTTQHALAFHPDSKVKTQEAYNCVGNFLDSLEEQQFTNETISKSKNIKQKLEKNTMTNLAIKILTEQNDLHFRIIWSKIEKLGYAPPRAGKTPWATLRTGLSAKPTIFKSIGRGIYRLII